YRVPEVWLFRNKSLKIYQLQQDNYQLRSLSLYFPEIDLSGIIARVFQQAADQGTGVALRELRRMLSM
ncbi:MAG: Uma2 family endonuclease, partial [Symploca sp. SIO2D2]|nr:Uma2 family endonuclease [Symploca sp. SIO2D2]